MKKTNNSISISTTREEALETCIRFCWFKAQKYSELGVDPDKCKLKDFTYICKVIIGVEEDSLDIIEEKALKTYEAITQINVCEDFACAHLMSKQNWLEGLNNEWFWYYSQGERFKVTAWEILQGKFNNTELPINPYRMKTMIVGSCNGLNDRKYYAVQKQ